MQLYMKIHGIKEVPKCKFCNKNCKYISLTKGFLRQCGDNDCKHKLFIENNKNIKEEHRLMYDNYLKDNLEFYRNVTIPFIDPYDNCIVKNHKQYCLKSASSLNILTEKRNRIYITNFYDSKNKIIYEIKPEVLENDLRNKNKFESAEKYAIENGMTFKIINEKYFKMCYNDKIIDYVSNDLKNKCLQLWRQFE